MVHQFTVLVERDGQTYIAYCPGLGMRAIGPTIAEARSKLADALEVFAQTASRAEVKRRQEFYLTQIEIDDGKPPSPHVRAEATAASLVASTRHVAVHFDPPVLPGLRLPAQIKTT